MAVMLVALLFTACSIEQKDPRESLCAVRLTTPGPKSIMSIFYGPIDFESLDLNDYQIFYRAVPLDEEGEPLANTENTYGCTGVNFKKLSSTLEPLYLSQGHWHFEIRVLPANTTESTFTKDAIKSKAILFGETDAFINLQSRTISVTVALPTDGNGNLYIAYSTPIFSKTNITTDLVGSPSGLVDENDLHYTEQSGTATYDEKVIIVSLFRVLDGIVKPAYDYYPDKKITYNLTSGKKTEAKGEYLIATETDTARMWQFKASNNVLSLPTGNYIIVIQDIETAVDADVIARKYYEENDGGTYDETGMMDYQFSNTVRSYLDYSTIYGETIAAYVAPKMTTIIKGNSEFSVDEITVDAGTTSIQHDCRNTDIHYYMNQYGEYCAYCAKGNIQAKQAAVTSHQYFYKRSDGIYCVVDLASIPLSPEAKDSTTKLTYAWEGYDRARTAAEREYENGTYKFTSFVEDPVSPENSSTKILSSDGSFLESHQFFYFLNFDGVLASFDNAHDAAIAKLSENTHLTCVDKNQGVTYSYIYNDTNWNEAEIHATNVKKVNQYTYLNAQGIYERTARTTNKNEIFYYVNDTTTRALEAGQRYCILFVNRNYTMINDDGSLSSTSGTTFTGKTLVALSYNLGYDSSKSPKNAANILPTVNNETHSLIAEFKNTRLDTNDTYSNDVQNQYRKFIWDASADWEVYTIMDKYQGVVSENETTTGIAMTAFTPSNNTTGRGNNFTAFMAGQDNTYDKAANISNPLLGVGSNNESNIRQRWEFFIDHNRDVVFINGFNPSNLVKAVKYAILLARPYVVYYNDEENKWGDATAAPGVMINKDYKVNNKTSPLMKDDDWVRRYKKDGRFVAALSPTLTRYAAGAYGTYISALDGEAVTDPNLTAITPTTKVEGQYAYFDSDVLGLAGGIYLSLSKEHDDDVKSLSASIGFYINRYGEVVSSGNDSLAESWAEQAGCVYYIDSQRLYHTVGRAPLPLESISSLEYVFSQKNLQTVPRELLTRIAAIRNSGAEYYYNYYGQYIKTGYNNDIFHLVKNPVTPSP